MAPLGLLLQVGQKNGTCLLDSLLLVQGACQVEVNGLGQHQAFLSSPGEHLLPRGRSTLVVRQPEEAHSKVVQRLDRVRLENQGPLEPGPRGGDVSLLVGLDPRGQDSLVLLREEMGAKPELRLAEDRFLTKDEGFDRVTYQVFEKP